MAFLDETGLATFLAYLKAWARATFASKTDTQTIEGATTFSQPIAGTIDLNTASRAMVTDGNGLAAASAVTAAELGHLSGVTSAIQTQIDNCVHKTGNESIGGTKDFSGSISVAGGIDGVDHIEFKQSTDSAGHGGFIDFHFNNSSADYTSRLIESSSGVLQVSGGFNVLGSTNLTSVKAKASDDNQIRLVDSNSSVGVIIRNDGSFFYVLKTASGDAESGTWDAARPFYIDLSTGACRVYGYVDNPSDERLKTQITEISDKAIDAWEDVQWQQFKLRASVERKKDAARLHFGVIAQKVQEAFKRKGLDACTFGLLCMDGNTFGVRYNEALALEAACQRRRADRLEARIKALEEKLNGK